MSAQQAASWLSWFLVGMAMVWILVLIDYLTTGDPTIGKMLLVVLAVIAIGGLAYWRLRATTRRARR